MLTLPGYAGPVPVEFLVDTGFDGELASPGSILQQLDASFSINQEIMLEGTPLLGVNLLAGSLLQAEMTDGGEVFIEPL